MSGIFLGGKNIFTMETKTVTHNVEYLKRLAKKIKKQQNLTHHQSLDEVAIKIGFRNWKHFLQNTKEKSSTLPIIKDQPDIKSLLKNKKPNPYRNLIVAALNELIDNKHISLNPIGINPEKEKGHVFLNLFGQSTVILWSNRGFDELLISVWWKYNHANHPQANLKGNCRENFNSPTPLANKHHYRKFVGVVASCWLERSTGKYLQGKNQEFISNIYTRKGELKNLKEIPRQEPKGYKTFGSFLF
ncbi:MAG: hypothetical protein AB7O73_15625 [Bacteroidia bacterium]